MGNRREAANYYYYRCRQTGAQAGEARSADNHLGDWKVIR